MTKVMYVRLRGNFLTNIDDHAHEAKLAVIVHTLI